MHSLSAPNFNSNASFDELHNLFFFFNARFQPSRKEVRTCSRATSRAAIMDSSGYRDKV